MTKRIASLLVLSCLALSRIGAAAEMPADIVQRRVEAVSVTADAPLPSRSLNRVETAELARSDANQKGGDVIVTVVMIAAIVALVYIYFQHTEHIATR